MNLPCEESKSEYIRRSKIGCWVAEGNEESCNLVLWTNWAHVLVHGIFDYRDDIPEYY